MSKKTCDHSGVEIPQSNEVELLKKEVDRLKKIIAKEFNENDELGCEYTYVNILKDMNRKLVEALKAVQKQSVAHFEDCEALVYDDQDCDCNAQKVELMVYQALKEYEESK